MSDQFTPILDFADARRDRIRQAATEGVANIFPIVGDHRTLEVDNLQLHRKDFSGEDHKNAILEGRSLTEPLKGDVVIKDKEGKVLDRRKGHTLMQVPYFTPLNTFVVRGNEYSVRNQLRTKPGVYTRVRGNGDLESSFNLRKGANFRLSMNPEKGHLNMEYGTSKIPLYPVLRELGMSHEDIAGQWGDNLAADNQAAFDKRRVNHAKKLYEKLTPVKKRTAVGRDQVAEAIRTSFDMTELDPTTTSKTLGQGFDKVSPQALLQASRKLLRVHRGEEEQDNRDSLEFQTLHSPEDFVRERLDLAKREFGWKTKSKLDLTSSPEVRKVLPTSALTPTLRSFLTSSQLSVAPTQINPVEILNSATNVTRFGEGGIQSSRAIPANVRTLHSSHLGVLDPFRTPESAAAGVDVGAALFASRDREGNIFTRLRNVRTGKTEHVPAAELSRATIAFPTQDVGRGRVDAISGGEVKKVRPGDVDYQVVHPQTLYGVSTNMIPFMDSQQGNRLIMASKFSQQALPLKESEEPLVQVDANSRRFKSWEQEVASKVLPLSPVDGEVTSIRKGFINIRGKDGDEHKLPYSKRHPLASKTYLSHYMKVKPGDKVKKDQVLADSNFTRNGTLALGKNLQVGYLAYHGLNSNDAVVISESTAQKMASKHMAKKVVQIDADTHVDHKKHSAQFPRTFTDDQYSALEDGLVKPGTILQPGDPIAAVVAKAPPSVESQMFGRVHKSLRKQFRDRSVTWDKDEPGEVIDVVRRNNRIAVTVKSIEPLKIGDKLCFTPDHEILTTEGWVPVGEVVPGHKAASLNPATGGLEYVGVVSLHSHEVDEPLYQVDTTQVSMCVTAAHKLWAQPRGTLEFSLAPASELAGRRYQLAMSAEWEGADPKSVYIPGAPSDQGGTTDSVTLSSLDYCTLVGLYVSEGSVVWDRQTGSYGIDIHQKSGSDSHRAIREWLETTGLAFWEGNDRFRLYSKALGVHFKPLGLSHQKYLPGHLFSYSKASLTALYAALMLGDGNATGSGHSYYTSSQQLAEDFQRLCLHVGMAGRVETRTPPKAGLAIAGRAVKTWRTQYRVSIYRKKLRPTVNHGHARTQSGQRETWVDFTGTVFCPELERNHILYVRRNGKVHWSGNSNRHGGKGVISKIVPDSEMVQAEDGSPLDLLWTSAGVVSRINPSQILETAVAKVAKKRGTPIAVQNFAKRDNVKWAKKLLKDEGIKDKETVYDPISGRKIPNIFVGPQYTYKMFKSTDTNFSARGIDGSYDINQQPSKGGLSGAKGTGRMEINALLAYDARDTLKENSTVKGTRNTDYWRAVQLGRPIPPPKQSFAYDKFTAMLKGMGVNMARKDNSMALAPLTDSDVGRMSSGEVQSGKMVRAKDLRSERGGLFDEAVTGGLSGQKWSHIELGEPVVSPIFTDSARRVLGLSGTELDEKIRRDGGGAIRRELNRIDPKARSKELRRSVWKMKPGTNQDNVVKQIKALEAVDKVGMKPGDAWTMKKLPVLPPMFRPIVPGPRGDILVADVNHMYKDAIIARDKLKEAKKAGLPSEDIGEVRKHLHDAVGAVVGTREPVSTKLQSTAAKGLLKTVVGTKTGFYNGKLVANRLDLSGRGTAAPDPSLGMDEVGLPEDMLWSMYNPFVMGRLVKSGNAALQAKSMLDNRAPRARDALMAELKSRPVLLNRAPTLHKHGIVSAYARPVAGKTIKVNPFIEPGMNLDYDGDALQVYVPASAGAIRDAEKMLVSNNVLTDKNPGDLNVFPAHEAIIGVYKATEGKATPGKKRRSFATSREALDAYNRGDVGINDPVEILRP